MRIQGSFVAILAVLLLIPTAVQGLDPFNDSTVTRLFETDDVNLVAADDFHALIFRSPLAVDSAGSVFLAFSERPSQFEFFQEIVRYTDDGAGGFTLDSVHRVDVVEGDQFGFLIMAMVVAPADTFDGNGDPVLVKDRVVLLVDGLDSVTDIPWRELQMIDPDGVDAPVVLFHQEPGGGFVAGGTHLFAVAGDGTFYTLADQSGGNSDDGNIHQIAYDSVTNEYVEEAIMTEGTVKGALATRSNGLVYSVHGVDRDVMEIDPSGVDLISTYSIGASLVGITFDANDRGWMDVAFGRRKKRIRTVTEFFAGEAISKDDRSAETSGNLRSHTITSDPNGAVYILEVDVDNSNPTPDVFSIWKIEPADAGEPPPPPAGTSSVESVIWSASGGPSGDKNVKVTVTVVDADDPGAAISGATVDFTVTLDDVVFDTFSETTNAAGEASVTIRNAPSGDYEVIDVDVVASGFTFDGFTPPNGFTKP